MQISTQLLQRCSRFTVVEISRSCVYDYFWWPFAIGNTCLFIYSCNPTLQTSPFHQTSYDFKKINFLVTIFSTIIFTGLSKIRWDLKYSLKLLQYVINPDNKLSYFSTSNWVEYLMLSIITRHIGLISLRSETYWNTILFERPYLVIKTGKCLSRIKLICFLRYICRVNVIFCLVILLIKLRASLQSLKRHQRVVNSVRTMSYRYTSHEH